MDMKATVGIEKFEPPKQESPTQWKPAKIDTDVLTYVTKRVKELKDARKRKLHGSDRSIEDIWNEIDREFTPHELTAGAGKKMLVEDETKGWASRWITLNKEDEWQSHHASPDLYVKVQTALSELIDQNPEGVFEPTNSKYEENTRIAEANYEQSWHTSGGKKELKLFVFNDARYGVGFFQTIPKLDIREKLVRTEYHPEDPSKDVFEKRNIVRSNGLCRRSLNPWNVWMDDAAKPGRYDEVRDCYHEEEMSEEQFRLEFPEATDIVFSATERPSDDEREENSTKDSVTETPKMIVGYYENCLIDLYAVIVPAKNRLLYASPNPNDEGKLTINYAPWTLRSDDSIYGIGIFEIIRGDSILYDRVSNMSVDQLTLSIYKSFFHKAMDQLGDDGTLKVSPGIGQALSDPKSIEWLEVPGPGKESANWLTFLQNRRDVNSGIPQQLYGQSGGATLGQDLQTKEAALQRMKLPLGFIVDMLEQEAYLTLSWLSQILSVPEILEYTDKEDLMKSLKELDLSDSQIQEYIRIGENLPEDQELFSQTTEPPTEEGMDSKITRRAHVYPETSFNLDKDKDGNLFENEKRRFYRWGLDLPTKKLSWKGIVHIIPQSVLVSSKELTRRLDLDLFNLVYPAIQAMVSNPILVPVLIHPIKQIIESFGKDPQDWLDEKTLMSMYESAKQPVPPGSDVKPSVSISLADLSNTSAQGMPQTLSNAQRQLLEKYYGVKVVDPLFVPAGGTAEPTAESVGSPKLPEGMPVDQPEMSTKSGVEAPQVADMGQAPATMSGAVEAGNRIV